MNKFITNRQLRGIFKSMPTESLPSGFMERLMSTVEKESARRTRKKRLTESLQAVAGIASMLLLPTLTVYLCDRFVPGFSFPEMNIDTCPNIVLICLTVLVLLTVDRLCRKHLTNK